MPTKENIFVSEQGNEYTFKKLPDGKLWIDGYLREKVDGAVWNEKYNCYMYTWERALKAVPAGLRLPTAREFLDLCLALGYLKISEERVVNRLIDECGFKMAGYCIVDNCSLLGQGSSLRVWSCSSYSATDTSTSYGLCANSSAVNPARGCDRCFGFGARCIKD